MGNPTNFLNENGIYDAATDYALFAAPCVGFKNVGIDVWEINEWYKTIFWWN